MYIHLLPLVAKWTCSLWGTRWHIQACLFILHTYMSWICVIDSESFLLSQDRHICSIYIYKHCYRTDMCKYVIEETDHLFHIYRTRATPIYIFVLHIYISHIHLYTYVHIYIYIYTYEIIDYRPLQTELCTLQPFPQGVRIVYDRLLGFLKARVPTCIVYF